MKRKDFEPIKFEVFQSEMEKIMYHINKAMNGKPDRYQLNLIHQDLEHKIGIHKERGEWLDE